MSPFGSPQPGNGGGGAALLLDFHWLTILALLLGALGLAASRIIALPLDQRPAWARRRGAHLFEWLGNAVGVVACAGVAIWLGLHPRIDRAELQMGVLLLLACLGAAQAVRGYIAWALDRSAIWAIRHGDLISHWTTRAMFVGLLATVIWVVQSQM